MCGICGFWDNNGALSDPQRTLRQMNEAISHRGPDSRGTYVSPDKAVGLGHLRLAIIDLSKAGNQPMHVASESLWITYNGEVYNFLELRQQLEARGYHFKSNTDTEVVLNAYLEWGVDCFRRFNGMFALAIWDGRQRELLIARDRFGQKPVYIWQHPNGCILFASEVRALLAAGSGTPTVNMAAVNCFLALGYILGPMSIYDGITKLEPGSCVVISNEGARWQHHRYWDYAEALRYKCADSAEEAAENVLALLDGAVKARTMADVPLGAFLSGGVDSSSIVALLKKYHTGRLHTFSMGFDVPAYSELPDANRAARWFDTEHHTRVCAMDDGLQVMNQALSAYDEPFADTSLIPMVQVAEVAAEQVTVVLSGDGADEIFGGYITYQADQIQRMAVYVPRIFKQLGLNAVQLSGQNEYQKLGWRFKARQFLSGSMGTAQQAHYAWRLVMDKEARIALLGESYRELVYDTDPWHLFDAHYRVVSDLMLLDQHLYVDAKTWLPDDILVKTDRATMYHSIEGRCPYLDVNLVKYAASLPAHFKIHGLRTKWLLKRALRDVVPEFVLTKKKAGFNAPVGVWLQAQDTFAAFHRYVWQERVSNANAEQAV